MLQINLNGQPEAYVAINKSRQKIYNKAGEKVILLNDKEEFQLEFFNPTNNTILVKIYLNGKPISNKGLVLRPGERTWLDRYLDDNKKFTFNTYDVGTSEEIQKAIANNGDLKIEFYDEYVRSSNFTYTYNCPTYDNSGFNYGSDNINEHRYCNNIFMSDMNNVNDSPAVTYSSHVKQIETGKIEKGDISNQQLNEIDIEFNSWISSTIQYKLLPISQQTSFYEKDLRKYCTQCRTRIKKSNWKFCPTCGDKI